MIAIFALGAVVLAEAAVIGVLRARVQHWKREADELQRKVDVRTNLLSGGREVSLAPNLFGELAIYRFRRA